MEFYYTTTSGYNQPQLNPFNSLGGYRSATLVGDNSLDNLFGEVSLYDMKNPVAQYACLILENDETIKENLEIWIDSLYEEEQPLCSIELGVVELSEDANGDTYSQNIINRNNAPQGVTFFTYTETSPGIIGSFAANKSIAIWIRRKVNESDITSLYNNVSQISPLNPHRYIPVEKPRYEGWKITLSWD